MKTGCPEGQSLTPKSYGVERSLSGKYNFQDRQHSSTGGGEGVKGRQPDSPPAASKGCCALGNRLQENEEKSKIFLFDLSEAIL